MTEPMPLFDIEVMHLTALMILLAACGHEQLDFALPDGGHSENANQDDAHSAQQMGHAGSVSSNRDSFDMSQLDQELPDAAGGAASTAGAASAAGSGAIGASQQAADQPGLYQDDPSGYPTSPGHLAESCSQGQSFNEVCGNDLDEDCDGTVDEYPGIGAPCLSGCGDGYGAYVCSTLTNTLLCLGGEGCIHMLPEPCGDGLLDAHEECDPNAPFEEAGVTCTATCTRPLFIRCVDAGIAQPELCDSLHVCNERIGACMPVIGRSQPRCPRLAIEGGSGNDEFYPMLETENGECWVTCSDSAQCPSSLPECYMGFCVVAF